MSARFDLDDDALLAMLRSVAQTQDPVPSEIAAFAKLAPLLIDLDVPLAKLVHEETLVEAAGVRDQELGRHCRFEVGGAFVHVDVMHRLVVGEFDEPGWSVEVRTTRGNELLAVDDGVFLFEPADQPFVLVFDRGDETVATEWLRA